MLREFSGNAKATTLNGGISAAATSIAVADATGYPTGATGPFVITIDTGLAAEEKVLCLSRTGNTLTVSARGWDGTTAADHANAAPVEHTFSATDAREANAHVNATAGAHAATAISFAPAAGVAATTVQAAIEEVVSDSIAAYLPIAGKAADSELLDGVEAAAFATKAETVALVDAAEDLLVGSAPDVLKRLPKGADGQVLSVIAGALGWSAPASSSQIAVGSYTGNGTTPRSFAVGFAPHLVIVRPRSNSFASAVIVTTTTTTVSVDGGEASTAHTAAAYLTATGFTATGTGQDTSINFNSASAVYDYVAIKL